MFNKENHILRKMALKINFQSLILATLLRKLHDFEQAIQPPQALFFSSIKWEKL